MVSSSTEQKIAELSYKEIAEIVQEHGREAAMLLAGATEYDIIWAELTEVLKKVESIPREPAKRVYCREFIQNGQATARFLDSQNNVVRRIQW
jgi:hypothetical protein